MAAALEDAFARGNVVVAFDGIAATYALAPEATA